MSFDGRSFEAAFITSRGSDARTCRVIQSDLREPCLERTALRPAVTDVSLGRGGVTLRGSASGTGPTVLLLHAGGEDRRVWDALLVPLTACGVRTVAYDLRGHGESTGVATSLEAIADDV